MSVTTEDIKKIARLAHLHIEEKDYPSYIRQMNAVLGYMEKLNEVNTGGVAPMMNSLDLKNVMREDEPQASLPREEALKNAPLSGDGFFCVPKVVKR